MLFPDWTGLGDVVEVAAANDNLKILVKLLTNLELADKLKGLTAQTIFAPSDEAFANLPEGTLKNWTTNQKKENHLILNVLPLVSNVFVFRSKG